MIPAVYPRGNVPSRIALADGVLRILRVLAITVPVALLGGTCARVVLLMDRVVAIMRHTKIM